MYICVYNTLKYIKTTKTTTEKRDSVSHTLFDENLLGFS